MLYKTICPDCKGDGWTWEHSYQHVMHSNDPDCYGYGCPVPVRCETCRSEGEIFNYIEDNEVYPDIDNVKL